MPKMTTEQFLSQLGIEVGKPFMLDGVKYKVIYRNPYWIAINLETGNEQMRSIEMLLNCEITPLPKYTLSEDEKAIVRNLKDDVDGLSRKDYGIVTVVRSDECIGWGNTFFKETLFQFIKEDEEVSLNELRKCL